MPYVSVLQTCWLDKQPQWFGHAAIGGVGCSGPSRLSSRAKVSLGVFSYPSPELIDGR